MWPAKPKELPIPDLMGTYYWFIEILSYYILCTCICKAEFFKFVYFPHFITAMMKLLKICFLSFVPIFWNWHHLQSDFELLNHFLSMTKKSLFRTNTKYSTFYSNIFFLFLMSLSQFDIATTPLKHCYHWIPSPKFHVWAIWNKFVANLSIVISISIDRSSRFLYDHKKTDGNAIK